MTNYTDLHMTIDELIEEYGYRLVLAAVALKAPPGQMPAWASGPFSPILPVPVEGEER